MMKSALQRLPACLLVASMAIACPARAFEGPLLPGLETSEAAPVPTKQNATEYSPPAAKPAFPVDDGITPLDEHGRPMLGPESSVPLRLPAPPLPAAPRVPARANQRPAAPPATEPPKRNLWQRSTDALRDLTGPKENQGSSKDEDAARNWQTLRRQTAQELEQQRRELQQRQHQQQQLQQRQLQRQLQQRQLQQRTPAATAQPTTGGTRSQPRRSYVPPAAQNRKTPQPREAKNEPRSPWERVY